MNVRRNILITGTAVLAAFAAVGCSADGTSTHGAKSGAASDAVTYHADYPAYSSLDDVIKQSDAVVEGTVVSSRVQRVLPDAPAGDDPATNPQAGLSPAEAKEAKKEAEANPVIVTVSKVKVTRTLSGKVSVGDTIEVSQLGGTYKGVAYQETDTTLLAKGAKKYVLMLAAHGKNPYDLLNPEQALYTVKSDGTVKAVSVGGFTNAGKVDQLAAKAGRIARNAR
ncbi:hypothetical protein ACFY71_30525 [Streptomyces cinerochromogenes]|uniref:hypothetical protein n=1 Tax=Streptomyces cinerochromogenes TaxID=66422 RepID=UPI00367DCBC6